MARFLFLSAAACFLAACNSMDVRPVAATGVQIKVVCIVRNPEADQIAPELEGAIENGLAKHGIGFRQVTAAPANDADYYLTYSAVGGWDLKPFLKTADIHLKHGPQQIGSAHFQAGGGLSTVKFNSTPDKIAPLMDELLAAGR
jgi:hypothetical protein